MVAIVTGKKQEDLKLKSLQVEVFQVKVKYEYQYGSEALTDYST